MNLQEYSKAKPKDIYTSTGSSAPPIKQCSKAGFFLLTFKIPSSTLLLFSAINSSSLKKWRVGGERRVGHNHMHHEALKHFY